MTPLNLFNDSEASYNRRLHPEIPDFKDEGLEADINYFDESTMEFHYHLDLSSEEGEFGGHMDDQTEGTRCDHLLAEKANPNANGLPGGGGSAKESLNSARIIRRGLEDEEMTG